MADLILEPFAVSQRWRFSPMDTNWETLIVEYLQTIARTCMKFDSCVIGHIKALALFPAGGYLQVSVIDPARPAGVKGCAPPDCPELTLALNVIVYGLEHDLLERIASDAAVHLASSRQGEVITET